MTHLYMHCPLCGHPTKHKILNKLHSIEHDHVECSVCGYKSNIHKHVPEFIGIRVHGLGGS